MFLSPEFDFAQSRLPEWNRSFKKKREGQIPIVRNKTTKRHNANDGKSIHQLDVDCAYGFA